jgi:hypothetical protein
MIATLRKQHACCSAALAVLACASFACGPTDPTTLVQDPGPLTKPFAVSDHFTPSGFMGDGEYMGKLTMDVNNENCKARPPGAQGYCYRFTYNEGPIMWAGVYWVFPANNWGTRPGRAIDGSKFKQVRAKVATNYDPCEFQPANYAAKAAYIGQHKDDDPNGYRFVPPNPWNLSLLAFAGGIAGLAGDCLMEGYPYLDCLPPDPVTQERKPYKTIWNAQTTTEWTEMRLNISPEKSLDYDAQKSWPASYDSILGAFGWAIEFPAPVGGSALQFGTSQGSWRGTGKPLEIYIDDVVWETDPVPPDNDERLNDMTKAPVCPSLIPDAGAPAVVVPEASAPETGAPGVDTDAGAPDSGTSDSPIADSATPDGDN